METKEGNEPPGAPRPMTRTVVEPPPQPPIENLGTIADAAPVAAPVSNTEIPQAPVPSPVPIAPVDIAIPPQAPIAPVEAPVSIPQPPPPPPQPQQEEPPIQLPTAGAEKEEEFPVFLIVPSTFSYIFSIVLILIMFLIYILSIGSIASFEGRFFPNVYMFWDFITTGNTTQYQNEFESYMKNVLLTTQNDMKKINEESFVGSSQEGFSNSLGMSWGRNWLDYIWASWSWFLREVQIMWNRILLNIMVRGNTIHVVR